MKTDLKEKEIMEFLKEAWCIDGSVLCTGSSFVLIEEPKEVLKSRTYILTDSRRGRFYVTLSINKP